MHNNFFKDPRANWTIMHGYYKMTSPCLEKTKHGSSYLGFTKEKKKGAFIFQLYGAKQLTTLLLGKYLKPI